MTDRPKRKAIPQRAKLAACERRLKQLLGTDRIEYNHEPALIFREVRSDGKDYIPAQTNPDFIEALSREEHARHTNGTAATSHGSVKHGAAKIDRITGKTKAGPKKPIPSRPFAEKPEGYKTQWPSQKIQSRPMRREEGR